MVPSTEPVRDPRQHSATTARHSRYRKVDTRQIDYTGYTANYDEQRRWGRRNRYLELVRYRAFERLLSRLPIQQPLVLDVGTGTGRGLSYLHRCRLTRVAGLDYTDAMLRRAVSNLKEDLGHDVPPGTLLRGDAYALPFADDSFDLVASFNFLHMFRLDLQCQIIREMTRVARPGASLIIEFDSLHKGLFFSRIPEQYRKADRTKFNACWELRTLFPRETFHTVRVAGTTFPLLHRILAHMPSLGVRIESAAHCGPLGWLTERVFVSATLR